MVAICVLDYCNIFVGWLLQRGPLLPRFRMVAIDRFPYCHRHLFLVARDSLSVATIIMLIATTKCGCYMCNFCNAIWFDFHHILVHQINILILVA
jgi:hypothetical protein